MKSIYFLLIFSTFLSSCSTYQATVKRHDNLQYEAVRVHPDWKHKDPKGKKWITPVIGLSAGAAYGYYNETNYGNETYSGAENAAIWGLGGLLVGRIINGVLFPKRNHRKTFDISQSEKWLESYNKTSGNNYMVQKKELNNTLILVPKYKVEQLREEYRLLQNDLERTTPTTDFYTLQNWKNKLNREYSILPPAEIDGISTTINRYEQKVVNKELLSKANNLNTLRNDHTALATLTSFRQDNHSIYSAAERSIQQKAQDIVDQKINLILDEILPNEIRAINSMKENFYSANSFYESFHRKFSHVSNYEQVRKGYSALENKKTLMVSSQSEKIEYEIKNSYTINQLNDVEKKYLSNVDRSAYQVINLNNQIEKRRKEIIELERKKEIAEKQRLKKQEEKQKELELKEFRKLMQETTTSGEPTEWQMEFAVNYQIQARIGQMEDLNNLDAGDNPGALILKLFGSTTAGTKASVTSFEKYGCVEANGKPGFSCDYVVKVRLSGNNPWYSTMNQLGGAEIKTARFAKVKGIWMLVEYME